MENLQVNFASVADTATMLGFPVDSIADLSVSNPRVFGVLVDATVLRLTNDKKNG